MYIIIKYFIDNEFDNVRFIRQFLKSVVERESRKLLKIGEKVKIDLNILIKT